MDTTPPRLSFVSNPRYSRTNITITWTYSEDASSTCTLQPPSSIAYRVSCDRNVTLSNLGEGLYTLFITATDTTGNVGRYMHTWTVGKGTTPVVK